MHNKLRGYQIGLAAIGIFTLVLVGLVVMRATAAAQDNKTDKAAQSIASTLNDYTLSHDTVPTSLTAANVKDVPSTISYTKLSATSYKLCMTYKAASSGFDATSTITSLATGGGLSSGFNSSTGSGTTDFLEVPPTHHAGANCQTIELNASNSSNDFFSADSNNGSSGTSIFKNLGTDQASARDTERTVDLRSLQSQLEAYYANQGVYPSNSNLGSNSSTNLTFIAANMVGMDKEALRDPKAPAGDYSLAVSGAGVANKYTYSATPANCDNVTNDCTSYTLIALPESGGSPIKYDSLN
jgi:type II secretory pathway pseudopilin PulG